MVIENNKNPVTKSIDEELEKVENYIEQALFYVDKALESDCFNERLINNRKIILDGKGNS